MAQTSWDTARVRDLLEKAREFTVAAGGRILGARLGMLLRRLDKDFHPGVLGDKKLVRLLSRYPDVGTIHENASAQDFEFRFHVEGAPTQTIDPQPDLPGFDISSSPESRGERIEHLLWVALVAERPPTVYIDLQTLRLVPDRDLGERLDAEPERYLRVPPISQDDLRVIARQFAEEHGDQAVRERLLPVLDRPSWFRDYTKEAEQLHLDRGWLDRHRAYVLERARAWLSKQGVRPERFIAPVTRAPRREPPRPVDAASKPRDRERSLAQIRKLVHSAIDRMTDDELLSLSIPLRYMVKK